MHQPLSSFNTRHCLFHPECVEKYPALAAKIVVVLAAWSHLETHMGLVFSRLLGSEEEKGIAIFNALSNLGAHTLDQVFKAVETLSIPQEQQDFLQALRILTGGVRNLRNPLAHGHWGLSPDIPNALLLRNPRESLKALGSLTRQYEMLLAESRKNGDSAVTALEIDDADVGDVIGEVFVYRENDFIEIYDRILAVFQYWKDFDVCFLTNPRNDKVYESARRRLFGSKEILDKVNRSRVERGEPPLPLS